MTLDFALFVTLVLIGGLLLKLFGASIKKATFWLLLAIYMFVAWNAVTIYNNYWEASVKVTNYELIDLARAVDRYQRLTKVDVTGLEDLMESLPQKDGTHPFVHNQRWETTGCVADVWGVPYYYDSETRTIRSAGAKWHFLKPRWYQDVYTQALPEY
jgi:hypothetical protein